jgi:hypothetical protein
MFQTSFALKELQISSNKGIIFVFVYPAVYKEIPTTYPNMKFKMN